MSTLQAVEFTNDGAGSQVAGGARGRAGGGAGAADRKGLRAWWRTLAEKWRPRARPGRGSLAEMRWQAAVLSRENAVLRTELERTRQLAGELAEAGESATAENRARNEFFESLGQELRAPLAGVIGVADRLLDSPLTAEQRNQIQCVCRSGEALLALMNDIVDYGKFEAGEFALAHEDFSLLEQLQFVIDLHAETAAQRRLEFLLDLDPAAPLRVRGDAVRLRQILLNLVGNAVRRTERGEVVVRVRREEAPAERARLSFEVSDTGAGIPAAAMATLFEPFGLAEGMPRGGSGLSLAISQRLAGMMRGGIAVRSAEGQGATFRLTVELEAALQAVPPRPAPALLENCRVLIVDDNATSRKLLDRLCNEWGLGHGVADSATAALAHLHWAAQDRRPFDLVIFDQDMPGSGGLGLAKAILADELIPRPAMVMLTSRGERLPQAQLAAHGIAACERKPVYGEKLRESLARVLGRAEAEAVEKVRGAGVSG